MFYFQINAFNHQGTETPSFLSSQRRLGSCPSLSSKDPSFRGDDKGRKKKGFDHGLTRINTDIGVFERVMVYSFLLRHPELASGSGEDKQEILKQVQDDDVGGGYRNASTSKKYSYPCLSVFICGDFKKWGVFFS